MCGSGRLLVPLASRGFKLHGVDSSAAMLASCEARVAERGIEVPLFRQDLTQLNLPFRYAAAFVASGSFQLITEPGAALLALQRIRAHLVDPGILLLDMFVPAESELRLGAPLVEVRTVRLGDGSQIALRSESTAWADARIVRTEYRYAHRRGATRLAEEHEKITLTWYAPEEISALLTDAGFSDRDDGRLTATQRQWNAIFCDGAQLTSQRERHVHGARYRVVIIRRAFAKAQVRVQRTRRPPSAPACRA